MADFGRHGTTIDYDEAVSRHGSHYHGPEGGFFPAPVIRSNIHRTEWNCETQGHRWSNTVDKWCLCCGKDKE
jgi:hypothetical protein